MKLTTTALIGWLAVALAASARADEKKDGNSMPRNDIHYVILPDGSNLSIYTALHSPEQQKTTDVWAARYPKGRGGKYPRIWSTLPLTSVDHVPRTARYYALVKVLQDRIFIFFTWNGHHCIIDKQTGRVLKNGVGDDVLKEYGDLMPLKLMVPTVSAARPWTEREEQQDGKGTEEGTEKGTLLILTV